MPDDRNDDERQRRHEEASRDQRETSTGEIRRMLIETLAGVGIDASTFEGRRTHAALLDHMRWLQKSSEKTEDTLRFAEEMRLQKAQIDRALAYIGQEMKRREDMGTEVRKGWVGILGTMLTGLIMGAGAALLAILGWHTPGAPK